MLNEYRNSSLAFSVIILDIASGFGLRICRNTKENIFIKIRNNTTSRNSHSIGLCPFYSCRLRVVTKPEVCIQQFFRVECHDLYNKTTDQTHETPLCPVEFSFPHHKWVDPFHLKHSGTSLSKKF